MFAEADAYERFMGRWSRLLAPALIEFAGVRDGDTVLDVGCGTGSLSAAVRDATKTSLVTGIDPSPGYVRRATDTKGDDRVRFEVGDAREIHLPDGSFDKTLSLLALNFVPDRTRAVDEMVRVTKPGGLVAAAVWDYGDGMAMLRVFWDEASVLDPSIASRDEKHMPLCKSGELEAAWRAAGLEKVDGLPLSVTLHFRSFDDYWEPFLLGQGPAGALATKLSKDGQAALGARLRKRLLGDGPDHPIEITARAWAVKGTRRGSGLASDRR